MRVKGTIPFGPREPGCRRVQVPENVNHTTHRRGHEGQKYSREMSQMGKSHAYPKLC